jgi:hypothetical protein
MFPVVLQVAHWPLCMYPCMYVHFSPIIGVLFIALNRNCCTLILIEHFLMLFHIILSVLSLFVKLCTASLIRSRFLFVDGCAIIGFLSLMPL